MSKAVGIDFGTSNSAVGYFEKGKPRLVPLEDNKVTIPSAVFYDTDRHETLFGHKAIASYIDHNEGRLLRALKSVLGSSLIEESTQIGGKRLAFKSIIGDFVRHLKTTSEHHLSHEVSAVVLGRPVWYVDDDATADRTAQDQMAAVAKAQGFKHIAFQFEPIAAALDYEQSVTSEELALIVDIGGGTSDFSIVRVSPERRGREDRKDDILANTGIHIGGTDFDRVLSTHQVMPLLGYQMARRDKPSLEMPASYFHDLATWHKIAMLYNNKTMVDLKQLHYIASQPELLDRFIRVIQDHEGHRLAGDVEAGKIVLSQQAATTIDLPYIERGLKTTLRRKGFVETTETLRKKITHQITECLTQAHVHAQDISTLFMTGGTTAIPSVYDACQATLPHARIIEGDKFGSVGMGLALDAGVKFGKAA